MQVGRIKVRLKKEVKVEFKARWLPVEVVQRPSLHLLKH
jgi:hypothetical protein